VVRYERSENLTTKAKGGGGLVQLRIEVFDDEQLTAERITFELCPAQNPTTDTPRNWENFLDSVRGKFFLLASCIPRFPGGTEGVKSLGGFRGG
jgi:hypothetical protein